MQIVQITVEINRRQKKDREKSMTPKVVFLGLLKLINCLADKPRGAGPGGREEREDKTPITSIKDERGDIIINSKSIKGK